MTEIHFFWWPVAFSEFWLFVVVFGGAILWSGHELRKATKFGKIGFKGRDYSRDEDHFLYRFYVGFWLVILACAVAGAIGWYFDLGMKP